MKPAAMKALKHEHWSAELTCIGNLAVRQAQTRNQQLGIPNWYSLKGRLTSDVPQPSLTPSVTLTERTLTGSFAHGQRSGRGQAGEVSMGSTCCSDMSISTGKINISTSS